jgi:signal transduction histidine kinase/CheY-like chemotaxis protein
MNLANFERVVHHLGERIHELREAAHADPVTQERIAEAALDELAVSVEELRVAEEELRCRTLELASAQRDVEAERRRYQEMYWNAPYPYVTTDLRGVICEANRAAGALLTAAPLELHGKPLALFAAKADRASLGEWLRALRTRAHCPRVKEMTLRTLPRSAEVHCTLEVTRIDGRGRDALRWTLTDLSGRDLALESARLREEARRKDEFTAVLGHELRNPLSAIAMATEVVESEELSARARWGIEIVHRHSDHLRRLIDDLLDASRVAHGKVELQRTAIDLADVVEHAIEAVDSAVRGRGQTVVVERSPITLDVDGDLVRLRQVVVNLLDNASKYTPSGGTLRVRISSEEGHAVVSVRDSGIGIPPERLQHIFTMFEQGDGSDRPSPTGLGLGLALARQLVELHGGTIEARSAGPGKGSEFIVRLPLAATHLRASSSRTASPLPAIATAVPAVAIVAPSSHAAAGPRQASSPARVAAGTEVPIAKIGVIPMFPRATRDDDPPLEVLLADDNQDAAQVLGLCLERLGHRVTVVNDGPAALATASGRSFQVAVLDLVMPGMDGFEVARRLRERQSDIFLVALTGYGDPQHRASAREAGFDHYAVKPVTVRELDRMLRRRRQRELLM